LAKILDLRKKSYGEYAQDKRDKMSDEHGKQLSIEETTRDTKMKPNEVEDIPDVEIDMKKKSESVQKARRAGKRGKGKQLALEEMLEDDAY
jgi:bisphosphoglycerate-dependent phosphoglycerate mutase